MGMFDKVAKSLKVGSIGNGLVRKSKTNPATLSPSAPAINTPVAPLPIAPIANLPSGPLPDAAAVSAQQATSVAANTMPADSQVPRLRSRKFKAMLDGMKR